MAALTELFHWGSWTWRAAEVVDREIDEEFDFHIDCHIRELIDAGMTPEQAADEAQRLFGPRDRLHRQCRAAVYGRGVWLTAAAGLAMLLSLGVIGWLASQLNQAQRQMANLQLLLAAQKPDGQQNAAADKHDLIGEIRDAHQKPVANAKVLVIYKSWPNDRYRQQAFQQTSDKEGRFRFRQLYSTSTQTGFLVTVLAEGHTLQSRYVLNPPQVSAKPFQFQLQPAVDKTLVIQGPDGKPLADVPVWPGSRKPRGSEDDHLMYDHSGPDAGYRTDKAGRVRMTLFQPDDAVELRLSLNQMTEAIRFTVDRTPEQVIGIASQSGVQGSVVDSSGQPIAGATVLLIHKTWPGGRFQQRPYKTETDAQGRFRFANGNVTEDYEAMLVTVVKDGFSFQSSYVIKDEGKTEGPFDFRLSPAVPKTLVLRNAAGQPLANATVALSQRKDAQDREHLVYFISAPSVSFQTDAGGRVTLNHFAAGDQVELYRLNGDDADDIRLRVDDQPEQVVEVQR